KKVINAVKSYLGVRPDSDSDRVFLNYQGEPISERGIRKLVVKYRVEAGITKKASCHTLRHTFATYKAEKGVSAYQLQQWLGCKRNSMGEKPHNGFRPLKPRPPVTGMPCIVE